MAERRRRSIPVLALLLLVLLLAAMGSPPAGARRGTVSPASTTGPPQLPVDLGRKFLTGLAIGPTEPGTSVPLQFQLSNPLPYPLTATDLTFGLYAFDPFPGTGAGPLPPNAAALSSGAQSGAEVTLAVGTLGPHAQNWSGPVSFDPASSAPDGTFAIRDRLTFSLNGSEYVLQSVGNWAPSDWRNATVLPNGTPTLNLTALGVSGVLPETAVLVRSGTPLDVALYVVLGGAVVLAIAGAYVGLRRKGPTSRSGSRSPPDESQAPSALGKRRSKDGD